MGIPDRLGQLYGLGVGQRRAGRVGVDSSTSASARKRAYQQNNERKENSAPV